MFAVLAMAVWFGEEGLLRAVVLAGPRHPLCILTRNALALWAAFCVFAGRYLSDERAHLLHNSDKFERLAVDLVATFQVASDSMTKEILQRKIPEFSVGIDPMELSYSAEMLEFISQQAPQSHLNTLWFGRMKQGTAWYRIIIALLTWWLLLPLYLITLSDDNPKNVHQSDEEESYLWAAYHFVFGNEEKGSEQAKGLKKPANLRRRLIALTGAPCSRFLVDMFTHFALLLVYGYVSLNKLPDYLSPLEWILVAWFAGLTLEEIRQACFTYTLSSWHQLRRSLNAWIWSPWNWIDVIILVLYWVSLFLRVSAVSDEVTKETVKFLLAVNTIPLWLRTARYYAASEFLGPKASPPLPDLGDVFACQPSS